MFCRAPGRLAAVFALILAPVVASCRQAEASPRAVGLSAQFFRPDSATVVARWARPCDWRGCADASRVTWTRAGVVARTATVAGTVDTLRPVVVPVGDSVAVTVAVVPVRRGLAGPARSLTLWLKNPDAAPPAVDSLRADTLANVYETALADSFPVKEVRAVTGAPLPRVWALALGDPPVVSCVVGRNRYTGDVRTFVPADVTDADLDAVDRACAPARAAYAAERAG